MASRGTNEGRSTGAHGVVRAGGQAVCGFVCGAGPRARVAPVVRRSTRPRREGIGRTRRSSRAAIVVAQAAEFGGIYGQFVANLASTATIVVLALRATEVKLDGKIEQMDGKIEQAKSETLAEIKAVATALTRAVDKLNSQIESLSHPRSALSGTEVLFMGAGGDERRTLPLFGGATTGEGAYSIIEAHVPSNWGEIMEVRIGTIRRLSPTDPHRLTLADVQARWIVLPVPSGEGRDTGTGKH